MKTLEILGENHQETWTERRIACRGIVIREGKILLSYEVNHDMYLLPGGGMEGRETPEECCRREVAEETGFLVSVRKQYLTITEFYQEWLFETHFFLCEVTGTTAPHLTEREIQGGLIPRWIPVEEALAIFSRHRDYADIYEEKRGIYQREYLAIQEYLSLSSTRL